MKKRTLSIIVTLVLLIVSISSVSAAEIKGSTGLEKNNSDLYMKLYNGEVAPRLDDKSIVTTDMVKSIIDNCNKYVIDVREVDQEGTATTYEASIIVNKTIKLKNGEGKSKKASIVESGPLAIRGTTLTKDETDIYCDVTYTVKFDYEREYCPDPNITYMYRMLNIKGLVNDIDDYQINVTKIEMGYAMCGNYYLNGSKSSGTEKSKVFTYKDYPTVGTTYYRTISNNGKYYITDDSVGGLTGRCEVFLERQGFNMDWK